MITQFKIYENNSENELLDMGDGIYWYRNVFFYEYDGYFRQYNIEHYILKNQKVVINYTLSKIHKNWEYYFSANYHNYHNIFTYELIDKFIDVLLRRTLIEQFCVIRHILFEMYTNGDDDDGIKINASITKLLESPEISKIVGVVLDYHDEKTTNGFIDELDRRLGKTKKGAIKEIDNYFLEQEAKKYNL